MSSEFSNLRLHRFPLSGHAHRAELFLSLLGIRAALVDVNLARGEQKSPEFLAKNPFGQVPVLEDGDVVIADSNAILVYLALRYDRSGRWYPLEPVAAAQVQRWLSVAAGQLAYGPAAARRAAVFGAQLDREQAKTAANALFALMDKHLGTRSFLASDEPTIADVAMYSYTDRAPEGGVSLDAYPNVLAWLRRIEALPGFVPMQRAGGGPSH
jgi:glutathione S-transferase